MSNDTTVHLIVYSNDQIEITCALAYLKNKDKSAELEFEEIKYNLLMGYFFRMYGFANENGSFIPITGEDGEIYDLLSRFPGLEIDGHYKDEYTAGELEYGYIKSQGDKSEDTPMICLKIALPSLYKSGGWQGKKFSSLGDFVFPLLAPFYYEGGSTSYPYNQNNLVTCEYYCEADEDLKVELWEETIQYLKKLRVPRDTLLIEECYYRETVMREEKVWGQESEDSSKVTKYEVDTFLNALDPANASTPKDLLDYPDELILNDLEFSDEDGNNVMHLAAISGKLKEFPPAFFTTENFLVKNKHGLSVRELAIENGYADQLPESIKMENFEELFKQASLLQKLKENGNHQAVQNIINSFPNPLFTP